MKTTKRALGILQAAIGIATLAAIELAPRMSQAKRDKAARNAKRAIDAAIKNLKG